MKTITADIMNISIAINNLHQVALPGSLSVINRGHIIQLQNELDVQLEILRLSNKAPKQRAC